MMETSLRNITIAASSETACAGGNILGDGTAIHSESSMDECPQTTLDLDLPSCGSNESSVPAKETDGTPPKESAASLSTANGKKAKLCIGCNKPFSKTNLNKHQKKCKNYQSLKALEKSPLGLRQLCIVCNKKQQNLSRHLKKSHKFKEDSIEYRNILMVSNVKTSLLFKDGHDFVVLDVCPTCKSLCRNLSYHRKTSKCIGETNTSNLTQYSTTNLISVEQVKVTKDKVEIISKRETMPHTFNMNLSSTTTKQSSSTPQERYMPSQVQDSNLLNEEQEPFMASEAQEPIVSNQLQETSLPKCLPDPLPDSSSICSQQNQLMEFRTSLGSAFKMTLEGSNTDPIEQNFDDGVPNEGSEGGASMEYESDEDIESEDSDGDWEPSMEPMDEDIETGKAKKIRGLQLGACPEKILENFLRYLNDNNFNRMKNHGKLVKSVRRILHDCGVRGDLEIIFDIDCEVVRKRWLEGVCLKRGNLPTSVRTYLLRMKSLVKFIQHELPRLKEKKLITGTLPVHNVKNLKRKLKLWYKARSPDAECHVALVKEEMDIDDSLIIHGEFSKYQQSEHVVETLNIFKRIRETKTRLGRQREGVRCRDHITTVFGVTNSARAGVICNLTLKNVEDKQEKGDPGFFQMCVLKHKTLRNYGSAVLTIPDVYMTLLQMYITYIRPSFMNEKQNGYVFVKWGGEPFDNSGDISDRMNEEFLKAGLFSKRRVGTNLLRRSFASDIHARDDIPEATYKACATQLSHSLQTQRTKYVVTKKHKETALGSKMVRESFGYMENSQLKDLGHKEMESGKEADQPSCADVAAVDFVIGQVMESNNGNNNSSSFGCIGPSMVDTSKLTERPTEETALKQTPSKKLLNPGKRPSTSNMKKYPETPTRKLKLSLHGTLSPRQLYDKKRYAKQKEDKKEKQEAEKNKTSRGMSKAHIALMQNSKTGQFLVYKPGASFTEHQHQLKEEVEELSEYSYTQLRSRWQYARDQFRGRLQRYVGDWVVDGGLGNLENFRIDKDGTFTQGDEESWLKPSSHPNFKSGIMVEDDLSYVCHMALVEKGGLKILVANGNELHGTAKLVKFSAVSSENEEMTKRENQSVPVVRLERLNVKLD